MADVLRSCAKTGCRWPAAASLSYRYATRQVWLLDLASAPDPSLYDLCPHHAEHLTVPNGWERVDDRSDMEVMVEPSASDRAAEAARRHPVAVGSTRTAHATASAPAAQPGRNRYAALVEALPRLAEENSHRLAAPRHAPTTIVSRAVDDAPARAAAPSSVRPAPASSQPAEPPTAAAPHVTQPTAQEPPLPPSRPWQPADDDVRTAQPIPSRDLAPLPAEPLYPGEQHTRGPDAAQDEPVPGQLAIPVDDLDDPDGVVVSFELAGTRRRAPRS